jgi:hypothetical protein
MQNWLKGAAIAVVSVGGDDRDFADAAIAGGGTRADVNVLRTTDGKAGSQRYLAGRRVGELESAGSSGAERSGPRTGSRACGSGGASASSRGNEIPYQPWAAAKQKENYENWLSRDPRSSATFRDSTRDLHAVPVSDPADRQQRHPYRVRVRERESRNQDGDDRAATRGYVDGSVGRSLEGDTLVVDVTGLNDQTWFDRAGNFHSEAVHVVERFTPVSPDVLDYQATIEDPKVFTRPWKIQMPLYRRHEQRAQLLEFKCVEFVEELMYGGPCVRRPAKSRNSARRA